jgi:hypothetical protein
MLCVVTYTSENALRECLHQVSRHINKSNGTRDTGEATKKQCNFSPRQVWGVRV